MSSVTRCGTAHTVVVNQSTAELAVAQIGCAAAVAIETHVVAEDEVFIGAAVDPVTERAANQHILTIITAQGIGAAQRPVRGFHATNRTEYDFGVITQHDVASVIAVDFVGPGATDQQIVPAVAINGVHPAVFDVAVCHE